MSISSWTARNRSLGKRWACIFCAFYTVLFNIFWWKDPTQDHCTDAQKED